MKRLGIGLGISGILLAIVACSEDAGTPNPGTAGTGGTPAAGTNAGGSVTGGSGGMVTAGTASGGGGASAGGTAAGAGGSGGATGGSGGAGGGGSGGGGGAACVTAPGKAIKFASKVIDMIAGDIGATDFVGGNTPRTLELWAKFTSEESWKAEQSIIELGKPNPGSNMVWGIDLSGRKEPGGVFGPYINCGCPADNNGTGAPPYVDKPANAGWLHLSWSYEGNGGKLEFTVDGEVVPAGQPNAGFTLSTTPGLVLLGASQNFGNEGWDGVMDEVRIWNVYRTPQQIKDNMKVILKGTETGLGAYYNFNEATGTDLNDVTMKPSRTLKACTASGGACKVANGAMPMRVDSDIPGPFTCAP